MQVQIAVLLINAYAASDVKRVKADPDWFIGEIGDDFYTSDLKNSWSNGYNDAAIIMLSRDGGEGKDLAMSDRDGISFLALHATELDWLFDEQYGVDAALWIGRALRVLRVSPIFSPERLLPPVTSSIPAAPGAKSGGALTDLKNQWKNLNNFLLDGRIELGNNRAERSIKLTLT